MDFKEIQRQNGHLCATEAKHILLHLSQALQAELQANVEEQEDDSQLCQVAHSVHILDHSQRMRPDQRATSLQLA